MNASSFDGLIRPIIKAAAAAALFLLTDAAGAAVNPGQTVDVARASHEHVDWWCPRLGRDRGSLRVT